MILKEKDITMKIFNEKSMLVLFTIYTIVAAILTYFVSALIFFTIPIAGLIFIIFTPKTKYDGKRE